MWTVTLKEKVYIFLQIANRYGDMKIQIVPGVKVNISGFNSRADAESKMSYTNGSDSQQLRNFLSAARTINNAAALRKVTSSLVTRVRKCIQADGRHFEQFASVLNGESVTVHLTT